MRVVYTPPAGDSQYYDANAMSPTDRFSPADYDTGGVENRVGNIVGKLSPENDHILNYIQGDLKDQKKIEKDNPRLDPRFIFVNSGFNLRPTDITAAIGFNQFKRLKTFIKIRNINNILLNVREHTHVNQ